MSRRRSHVHDNASERAGTDAPVTDADAVAGTDAAAHFGNYALAGRRAGIALYVILMFMLLSVITYITLTPFILSG